MRVSHQFVGVSRGMRGRIGVSRGPGFSSRSTTVPEGCPNSDLMKKIDVHLGEKKGDMT